MIENKDIEGRNRYLKKAQQMIIEIMSMLDMEQEESKMIFAFYEYLCHSLVEANIHNDIKK